MARIIRKKTPNEAQIQPQAHQLPIDPKAIPESSNVPKLTKDRLAGYTDKARRALARSRFVSRRRRMKTMAEAP